MTLIIFIPHQLLSSPIPSSLFLLISTRQSCFHALYNYVCVYESIQNPGLTDEKKEWAFVFLKRWAMFELSSRYLCLDTYGWGFYSTLGSEKSWWISESFLSCLIASSRRALLQASLRWACREAKTQLAVLMGCCSGGESQIAWPYHNSFLFE